MCDSPRVSRQPRSHPQETTKPRRWRPPGKGCWGRMRVSGTWKAPHFASAKECRRRRRRRSFFSLILPAAAPSTAAKHYRSDIRAELSAQLLSAAIIDKTWTRISWGLLVVLPVLPLTADMPSRKQPMMHGDKSLYCMRCIIELRGQLIVVHVAIQFRRAPRTLLRAVFCFLSRVLSTVIRTQNTSGRLLAIMNHFFLLFFWLGVWLSSKGISTRTYDSSDKQFECLGRRANCVVRRVLECAPPIARLRAR